MLDELNRIIAQMPAHAGYATLSQKFLSRVRDALSTPADDFVTSFSTMAAAVHSNAVAHGWWDAERNDGEMIALMHSELSEALEYIRQGNPSDDHCPEFNGAVVEFADVIIRIMDTCHAKGWPLAEAILAKHKYNVTRPYKHGKAF